MKTKRQKAIIDFAKNHKNFQTMNVLSFISKNFTVNRITITRDLSFLVSENILTKSGKGRSVKYNLSKHNKIIEKINVDEYFLKSYLERDVQKKFNFDIFETLRNNLFTEKEKSKLSELHTSFVKNFSKYDSQTLINKEFERIMIEFSWKSSAIEGNTYSLLSTEFLIKENIKDENKTQEETQMILNHKDAFNESILNKERFLKLNYADIEYIHTVLTKKLNVTRNIRSLPVGITGTKYKPLDNQFQIKEALDEMVKLINEKESFFEKSFLSLVLISYIQAFEDGNKRTARMFSNAILLANNSIPLSYRAVDVKEYKKASLLFYEINNISYLKEIFIEQFKDAVENYFI